MNLQFRYTLVIVVYDKQPEECDTLKSLGAMSQDVKQSLRLIVWDNSQQAWGEKEQEKLAGLAGCARLEYHHNGGENKPLSWIYNQSIRLLDEEDFMVIFDDDSVFDDHLFLTADQAATNHPHTDLFLPIVHFGEIIASPAFMWWFKGRFLKEVSPGMMPSLHHTAINSGMIIRKDYLKGDFPGYDEQIHFYCTDNDFMSRYAENRKEFCVLDYHMNHHLGFYDESEPYEMKSKRLRNQCHSLEILMRRKGIVAFIMTKIYLAAYTVKFAIRHRDIRYAKLW